MNEESAMEQIDEAPRRATLVLLPKKSRQQYKIAFKNVLQCYEEKSVSEKCIENVLLTYFKDCSQDWKFLIKTMHIASTPMWILANMLFIAFLRPQGLPV